MSRSTALPLAAVVLRILIVLNILMGAAIFALLMATILREAWTFKALGIDDASGIPAAIMGLRAIAALGVAATIGNHAILTRLDRIVGTVREGDPFLAINAYRLNTIAWVLLGLQLLSIVIAAIARWISTPDLPVKVDAGFSLAGWLAVILTFVLARVFAKGAMMREDLEGTI